jgi:hypothetical protein
MDQIIPFVNVRPLQIGSLSHNGVPVHPLQFQRLLRAQSVDPDSLVILIDRHPIGLLSAYALWIFRVNLWPIFYSQFKLISYMAMMVHSC